MKKKKSDSAGKTAKTAKTADAKAFAHTSIEVAANQLRPAPWNPRPEITSESVADITASLPKVGLIHPLVVMKDPDKPSVKGVDFYLIISGHRRYKACVDARYYPIPCDLVDVDVATAKQMTIIENLQRRDADPLLESELVKSLLDDGMTQAEIAAETGRGERWVARRANLMKLSKSWRERVKKGEKFTTDCLEHIAAYPEEIQEKCRDATGDYYGGRNQGTFTWNELGWIFNRESRDLKSATFDTAECLGCTNNTGCCPDLFDQDGGKDAKLGRCLCDRCWRDKHEAHVSSTVAKAEKKGVEIVRKKPDSPWAATDRKTKEYTTLYVYKDGDQQVAKWFRPPEKDEEAVKAAKAKRREEKRLHRLIATAQNEADEKFDEWIGERHKDGKWPKWFIERAVEMLLEFQGESEVDLWAANTGFTASDADADAAYKEYLAKTCGSAAGGEDADQDAEDDIDDATSGEGD